MVLGVVYAIERRAVAAVLVAVAAWLAVYFAVSRRRNQAAAGRPLIGM